MSQQNATTDVAQVATRLGIAGGVTGFTQLVSSTFGDRAKNGSLSWVDYVHTSVKLVEKASAYDTELRGESKAKLALDVCVAISIIVAQLVPGAGAAVYIAVELLPIVARVIQAAVDAYNSGLGDKLKSRCRGCCCC